MGKDYAVVQNVDAFSFFDSIVGGNGIQYETAGALGKGERIFITAKLPNYIKVGNNDLLEQYLFLTTSHNPAYSECETKTRTGTSSHGHHQQLIQPVGRNI